jgi:hypothetical protein
MSYFNMTVMATISTTPCVCVGRWKGHCGVGTVLTGRCIVEIVSLMHIVTILYTGLRYCIPTSTFSTTNFLMHRQVWNGTFFDKTTLQSLGLRVQLGHGGSSCPSPQVAHSNFMVIDMTGIHLVSVDFCDCRQDGVDHRRTQLLRAAWFPATFDQPRTVFTFDVLETFHELTLQGKTTLYDFYYMILRKTDIHKLGKAMVSEIVVLFNFSFLSH